MVTKGKKAITLFVDANLYNQYKKFCSDRGFKMSKGFEFYMKSQLSGHELGKNDLETFISKKFNELLALREGGTRGKV